MFYRFLIVDDEYYIRQHIRHCIDWEQLGFQCAGEVSNAAMALEFLNHTPVELMVLDISMPGMSGLDLLKALPPDKMPRTIILSGFATFDYARNAISYGVQSYLLKPVKSHELMEAVKTVKQQLDVEKNFEKERQMLVYHSQIVQKEERDKFFRHLFSGHIPGNSGDLLSKYHIYPEQTYYILIFDAYSDSITAPSYELKQSWRHAMENMIGQIFCENKVFLLTQDNYGRSAVILDGKREEFLLSPKIKQLKEILCQHLNLHLLSGYGFCENGSAEKLCYGYRLALDFFRFRSIYSQDINVFQTKLPDITLLDSLNLLNTQVKTHLFNRQNQNLQQALHDIFHIMRTNLFPLPALESELFALMDIAIHYCAVKKLEILKDPENYASYNCSEMVRSGISSIQMEQKFQLLFETLTDSSADESGQFIEIIVQQAVQLINQNYMKDDLSLNSIASELLISPSYLSRNFTKLQGISLTSYLTCTRLENARRLLSDTDLSIAEISAKSGYRDLFYFSKRFKSCFGVSPSRYRAEFQAGESDRKH